MQDWDHRDNREVDWLLGSTLMVRSEALKQVGGMDENIFLYLEDVDWCYRMWEKGWKVCYMAEAEMPHKHIRASMNKILSKEMLVHFKSLFYYLHKHGLTLPANCPSALELI